MYCIEYIYVICRPGGPYWPAVLGRTPDRGHSFSQYGPTRDPFLERPGNLTGPKSYFKMEVSRKVGSVMTSNEVHFVSVADNLTVQFSNLLKLPSRMENKTA